MLNSNSVVLFITSPSRVTYCTATLLDHILTNENSSSLPPFVIDHFIADYFPVVVSVLYSFSSSHTPLKYINLVEDFKK